MFGGVYQGCRVLVTGHTGFKGSWLAYWLKQLGADVVGYSLEPPTEPSHWNLLDSDISSEIGDVRDLEHVVRLVSDFRPEIVFHLAAQALVRPSYETPVETFGTNVLGTVNVLEACRKTESVRAIVNVTSDKCYENREVNRGYSETDAMGGHDPYSASKGCAELVASAFRNSYFNAPGNKTLLASCRAGNVIGGGDWAIDRLIPDAVRSMNQGERLLIRNPRATRPWQHVLEPLSGYLLIGQKLLEEDRTAADGWNLGPAEDSVLCVEEVASIVKRFWPDLNIGMATCADDLHEAGLLQLDCTKARTDLKWHGVWGAETAIQRTVQWYRSFYETQKLATQEDLAAYVADAQAQGLGWTE